eukprot:CAMPEP_0119052392 /NCGR_PEP_ID=MMETSP1177-20130426/73707_1 /TAXON_ID=2985 /ORGANISM="Ochromonas sp, Strain CCMP1899" /LENGTH=720 /DNA_ID=CAMNT_0007031945 /DNA_START=118 /DNA_END=2280 /DNA_ORIENTATION=+
MAFAENVNGFTPSFVSLALSGLTHRFILVLECESRQYEGEAAISHPRFCVGGPRATLDPRNVAITDLLPLGGCRIDLPPGWEKVHQLLYVVQQSTDEHGWQYRSHWPKVASETADEPWCNNHATNADVRRRLWMTTVVRRDDILSAKRKISDLILSRQRGVILNGPLMRLETDAAGNKKWMSRKCSLLDEKIEMVDEETGEKVDELRVLGNQIKMLDGYAFSVRKLDGSYCTLFDTDSKETRRRWLIAISYQIAVRGPLIDFAPFPYAPPLGEDIGNRIILCGELLKKGQTGINWKNRFFKLTPRELQYFDREALKGSIKIDGATVKSEEKSLEISLRSKSGVTVVVKSATIPDKLIWVNAFEAQIDILGSKIVSAARTVTAEEEVLTFTTPEDMATGKCIVIPSALLKEEASSLGSNNDNHLNSSLYSYVSKGGDSTPPPIAITETPHTPPTPLLSYGDSSTGYGDDGVFISEGSSSSIEAGKGGEGAVDGVVEFIADDDEDEEWRIEDDDDEDEDDIDEHAMQNMSLTSDSQLDINGVKQVSKMSRDSNGDEISPAKSKVFKFGIDPEISVSVQDFGIAPELLTTAQKVAILESAAYQNKATAVQPKHLSASKEVKTRKTSIWDVVKAQESIKAPDSGYSPTGLRLSNIDEKHTKIENDGGSVAKTQDSLRSKISAWESWTKEKALNESKAKNSPNPSGKSPRESTSESTKESNSEPV